MAITAPSTVQLGGKLCASNPTGIEWVNSTPAQVDFTRSEVTVEQFEECVEAGSCTQANFADHTTSQCNYGEVQAANLHPMNCVNLFGAREYCAWVGGRLPREDEWFAEASNSDTQILSLGRYAVSFL